MKRLRAPPERHAGASELGRSPCREPHRPGAVSCCSWWMATSRHVRRTSTGPRAELGLSLGAAIQADIRSSSVTVDLLCGICRTMQLTPAQQEALLQRLNGIWPQPRICPVCKTPGPWALGSVCELRDYHEGTLVGGGPVTPLVSVHCSNCGHTMLFSAIRLGVVDQATGKLATR